MPSTAPDTRGRVRLLALVLVVLVLLPGCGRRAADDDGGPTGTATPARTCGLGSAAPASHGATATQDAPVTEELPPPPGPGEQARSTDFTVAP